MSKDKAAVDFSQFDAGSYCRDGQSNDIFTTTLGAFAILTVWVTWIAGILSPVWMAYLFFKGYYILFLLWAVLLIWPFVFTVTPSPTFIRFILMMGGWFKGGTALIVEDSMKNVDTNGPIMLCMGPHGILPHSFFLNGAGRIHARKPRRYLPPLYQHMSLRSTGVAEPLLFKIPIIRLFLDLFGCAEPATKDRMHDIFRRKGGSEEIFLTEAGKENIYIKNRKGFLKYALQNGYSIAIGYNFGESDLFWTLTWGRAWRMRLREKTKILLFAAWGKWWCPILPRNDHPLVTVVGNWFQLPKIDKPTQADLDKWHKVYVEKLIDLFERNKERLGYGDRTLQLF